MITIFIDLDNTIFRTVRYERDLYASVSKWVPKNIYWQTYGIATGTYETGWKYTFEEHAKMLAENCGRNPSFYLSKMRTINLRSRHYLYSDTKQLLKFISGLKNVKSVLLTFGNTRFQKLKLKNTGITKYFDRIIFTQRHKHETNLDIKKDGKDVIFINDNVKEFLALKKKYPKAEFLLMSHLLKLYKDIKHSFPIFQNLKQVKSYLNKKTSSNS